MLQTQGLKTLDDLRAFLAGSQGVEIQPPVREACDAFVGQTLKRFGYRRLGKAEKGLVWAYLAKVTGLSRARLTRLVGRVRDGEALRDRRGSPAKPVARRDTPEDIRLLAEVDARHGNRSGPATRKRCERAWEGFGEARYERLAGIANGHRYHRRAPRPIRAAGGGWTRCGRYRSASASGAVPAPRAARTSGGVDTVHQGDRDGVKGLYHLNLVDAVIPFPCVGSVGRISEHVLLSVLAARLDAFPCVILGCHRDNGSAYLNARVAARLAKLHAEFTQSRAPHPRQRPGRESERLGRPPAPRLPPPPGSRCPAG